MRIWYSRAPDIGIIVSKQEDLPEHPVELQEYTWGKTSLFFVVDDRFTAAERQMSYLEFINRHHEWN